MNEHDIGHRIWILAHAALGDATCHRMDRDDFNRGALSLRIDGIGTVDLAADHCDRRSPVSAAVVGS